MSDLDLAIRWLAGIATAAAFMFGSWTCSMCNAIGDQQVFYESRLADTAMLRDVLFDTLQTSNAAVKSSTQVIDKVARIDYFLEQGQAMERFRLQLTSDLELERRPGMGIGGCE